jgi:hypothetical protein
MPEDLKEKLKVEADQRGVSLNAEIILRLENSLASSIIGGSELPPAEDLARSSEVSLMEVREAAWSEIVKKIVHESRLGRRECHLHLSEIEGLDPEMYDHADILLVLTGRLEGKGYAVERSGDYEIDVKW